MQEIVENISQDLVLGLSNATQWGDGSDGSFKIIPVSGSLKIQKRIAGVWTEVGTFG